MSAAKKISFKTITQALLDESQPFPPRFLHRFTDLQPGDFGALKKTWPKISQRRRQALLEDLEALGEADDLLCFEEIGQLALTDPDPLVRLPAVRMLSVYENIVLLPIFLEMVEKDADEGVRAASATALAPFVYLGEVELLPPSTARKLEDRLLGVVSSADTPLVRRRALEALGYSSREELIPLIEHAFTSKEPDWQTSALFAMGRSANEHWHPKVQASLDHLLPAVRAEAASAAGELEMHAAVSHLLELLDDSDSDVRMAAVWALSQIGGEGVGEALEKLLESSDDEDEIDLLDNALQNLAFTKGSDGFTLVDFTNPDQDWDDDLLDYADDEELDELPSDEDIDRDVDDTVDEGMEA